MTITEFAFRFLPQLVNRYRMGDLPFHALVDFDLWKQIFPDQTGLVDQTNLKWYTVQLCAHCMTDDTLLLSFTFPQPTRVGEPKIAGIRLDRTQQTAEYYVLTKPRHYDDDWDIVTPLVDNDTASTGDSKTTDAKPTFRCKILGTDSLRNFVNSVQQRPFPDPLQSGSVMQTLLKYVKGVTKAAGGQQGS